MTLLIGLAFRRGVEVYPKGSTCCLIVSVLYSVQWGDAIREVICRSREVGVIWVTSLSKESNQMSHLKSEVSLLPILAGIWTEQTCLD